MGLEVRRVPPHFDHPRDEDGKYKPFHEQQYSEVLEDWIDQHRQWQQKTHPDYTSRYKFYGQYEPPPNAEYYNTYYTKEEATWYQLYETITEGTPVTPAFVREDELIHYLHIYGLGAENSMTLEEATEVVKGATYS